MRRRARSNSRFFDPTAIAVASAQQYGGDLPSRDLSESAFTWSSRLGARCLGGLPPTIEKADDSGSGSWNIA
jgi:hypothetical protein